MHTHRPTCPPHPTARQYARSPHDVPDIVLCTGVAEHYRDNVHDVLKLVLVPDAPFQVRRRGATFRAEPGQLVALHADDTHSGGPLDDTEPPWLLMCLPPSLLAWAGTERHLSLRDPLLDDTTIAGSYLGLYRLLESSAPTLDKEIATIRFVTALAERVDPPKPSTGPDAPDSRARLARDYLGDHLNRNVSLTELGELTGLSVYQVTRLFARQYGLPPHTMHLRLRLDRAQAMLRQGRQLADVAHATGFADQAHLTRSFRQTYGVTPGQYRGISQRLVAPSR